MVAYGENGWDGPDEGVVLVGGERPGELDAVEVGGASDTLVERVTGGGVPSANPVDGTLDPSEYGEDGPVEDG